jgi:hypothetical protein
MAASAFKVQPHVAHAQEFKGTIDRHKKDIANRLITVFTNFFPAPQVLPGASKMELKRMTARSAHRAPRTI